ncbi:TRAP transporter large permease [Bacillus shivajii]|uniref:TRAP transporter large permease n=1 Tax=Bacillus shivajii TaxID=1983719 RepID=UPI001CFB0F8E|nr:TRAP transporter large permease [Bacillus shivajii]UCZ52907.1 TRAP transporter large permease [Bacillus shivajii]
MTLIILFVLFLFLLILGMPVAFAMGIASISSIVTTLEVPLSIIPQRLFASVNSFPLMAVPFFILAGYLMNVGGITERLVNFARTLVGHLAGGLAQTNVVTSMLFSGISGSASADASAIGSTMIPAMKRDGYSSSFSASVTAASATIGPIIPPSIVIVIYGSMTELSIGVLFAAGIIPGIMLGFAQMMIVHSYAKKRGYKSEQKVPFSMVIMKFKEAFWALLAPIVILGGILGGIFTATEAGVIACAYAFIVGMFIYKEIRLKDIRKILLDATVMTSVPILILAMASIFGWILATQQFSSTLVNGISSISDNPYVILFIVILLLLIVGLFIEALAAMIIFIPVLTPLVMHFGWDPIHFGIVVVVAMLIGTVTPPVGIQLYIAAAIAKVRVSKITEIWSFVLVMIVVLLLVAYIPQLTTWLPSILF